ncbi:MAG TPA: ParB/RepB/Spo0J family partition protein [Bacillota bacterium]|nr:ParB/RepB/Spo0J family partition protein [Bacillota bacterium]HPF42302.1 ParB/RepB/Spo0J family partition protein [Bacillota bacterium]HPJ86170.1 ParB/RepB/Spo0J family partition protein [Bacillota bacterium]HPQ61893.1 ParB/RepB/Spo0J family partition protein [Bacillota bacterium]HRX92321.1 ParB/RepB/Spo0J family partition protein [Candidatus Izemoplasmatales bacterium]
MPKTTLVKRGLGDLLAENEIVDLDKEEVVDIEISKITPNPFQPRKHFDTEAMNELAESIRINGVLQPVIVKKIADGYMLVAGERRCKASEMAGFSTVPAIVRDYNNQYLAELALLENIQREDLTIVEEAKAYQNAIESLHLTHLELSRKIGKSRSYVSNTLGILSLPDSIQDEINTGNISMGHARALSKLKDVNRIKTIAKMVVEQNLTVRDIENLVKKEKKRNEINRQPVNEELKTELLEVKTELENKYGIQNKVKVSSNKLTITFQNENELAEFRKKLSGDN